MPYKLSANGKCVVRADTGKVMKCYDNHADALAYLRALWANVEKARSNVRLKSLITKGGGPQHKDGTTGPGSGGARSGAGRKKISEIGLVSSRKGRRAKPIARRRVKIPLPEAAGTPVVTDTIEYKNSAPKAVLDFENAHATDKKESMLIVSPAGTKVIQKSGDEKRIELSPEELLNVYRTPHAIFTHNHPYIDSKDEYSLPGLSDNDLKTAVDVHVKEVRVVDRWYVYQWQFPERQINPVTFDSTYVDVSNEKSHYWNARIATGYPEQAAKQQWAVDMLSELATRTNSIYRIFDRETGKPVMDATVNGLPHYGK